MDGLVCFCFLTLAARVSAFTDSIEIPAFEYIRRFENPLILGQCPKRFVSYPQGPTPEKCSFPDRMGRTTHKNKQVHSQINVVIFDATQLFRHVRLCDDKSATYFGLLNKGDCLASEIANKLTFKDKHVTRMYLEHFRPRVDMLQPSKLNIPPEYTWYLNNTYYTNNIGIGTEEVLLVEMQFKDSSHAIKARSHQMKSRVMSDNLEYIAKHIGLPKKLKVIRLSSSDQDLDVQVFRGASAYEDGLAYVKQCQHKIRKVRHELMQRKRDSHLKYGFRAYEIPQGPIAQPISSISDADKRKNWEDVTLLQVEAKRVYVTYKRFRKYCRKSKLLRHKFCPLIKDSLRKVKRIVTGVHTQRRDWSQIGYDYQVKFITKGQRAVKSFKTRLQVATKAMKRSLRSKRHRKG